MGAWLASRFVSPMMLGFGALIAIPILIWLFNRYRYKKVEWAAMEFILRALKKNRRRLQLENLLLLLLRILAILLFVFAIARPRAPTNPAQVADEETGRVRRNVVIVLDNSWSMGYRLGAETVFNRGVLASREILRSLKAGDRVALVEASDGAQAITSRPYSLDERGVVAMVSKLDDIRLSNRPGEVSPILRQIPAVLRRFDPGGAEGTATTKSAKTVYLITDAQRTAWLDDQGALLDPSLTSTLSEIGAENGVLTIVDVGDDEAQNVGVTDLKIGETVVAEHVPVRFEVRVRNWSDRPVTGLQLEYYVDDIPGPLRQASPRLTTTVTLEPRSTRTFTNFEHAFEGLGAHRVQVRLVSDALDVDNGRSLVVNVREAIKILLVDGQPDPEEWESESDFLAAAFEMPEDDLFAGGALYEATVRSDHELPDLALSDYDVVVLANVPTPTAEVAGELERFCLDGGSVIVFLGDNVESEAYNARLFRGGEGLLPVAIGEPSEEGSFDRNDPDLSRWYLYPTGPKGGPLGVWQGDSELLPLLRSADFFRFIACAEPDEADDASIVVRARFFRRPANETPGSLALPPRGDLSTAPPAIIEKKIGRGRAMLFTTTADADWHQLATSVYAWPIFVPEIVGYLVRDRVGGANLRVGDIYEATVPPEYFVPRAEIRLPSGDEVDRTLSRIGDGQRFRLEFEDTEDPGLYEVVYSAKRSEDDGGAPGDGAPGGGEKIDYFAVNVESFEGDLSRLDEESLRSLLSDATFEWTDERGLESLLRGPGRGATGFEYWLWFIGAALVVLILESFLAMLFERMRR